MVSSMFVFHRQIDCKMILYECEIKIHISINVYYLSTQQGKFIEVKCYKIVWFFFYHFALLCAQLIEFFLNVYLNETPVDIFLNIYLIIIEYLLV